MKKILTAIFVASIFSTPVMAGTENQQAYAPMDFECQWINGYYRKDGTYVQGHYRGCP